MAAFDYGRTRATAERLIAKFGQTGAVRRFASTSGHDPTLTPVDHPATLAVLGYDESEIDGTLVLATDRKVYVSTEGLTISPTPADKIVIGGQALEIVSVKPLNPAGTIVFWEIQARA